jgi:uncharacterized protein YpmS
VIKFCRPIDGNAFVIESKSVDYIFQMEKKLRINHRYMLILLAFASLLVASLSCNLPINLSQAPASNLLPTQVIPTGTGEITFTLTETELNTLVAESLQAQPQQDITDAVVYIRNGKIQVKAHIKQNSLSLPLTLNLNVVADGQGGIQYQVISGSIGPFPLSQDQLGQIESRLSNALDGQIQQATNNIYIENVLIGDGFLTITGHARYS